MYLSKQILENTTGMHGMYLANWILCQIVDSWDISVRLKVLDISHSKRWMFNILKTSMNFEIFQSRFTTTIQNVQRSEWQAKVKCWIGQILITLWIFFLQTIIIKIKFEMKTHCTGTPQHTMPSHNNNKTCNGTSWN